MTCGSTSNNDNDDNNNNDNDNNNNGNDDNCDASQQQFLFRYETSVRKLPTRPTKFKLAYAQKASNRNKVGFGIKSCKKAKIYRKKSNDKFWNPYVDLIMCISMICIYLMKQVNKWQPVELPTFTSGFVKL